MSTSPSSSARFAASPGLEGLDGFVDLLEEIIPDIEGGPCSVPRASPGAAQGLEDPDQLIELLPGVPGLGHGPHP